MDIRENKRYVDIGTGNGYIAFELAKRFGNIFITGLDIAEKSIEINTQIAQKEQLSHLNFETYQGITFPFQNESFYGIISRYALHHFPNIILSVREMYRILEPYGFVIIADPLTYDEDTVGFVDQFQALKKDGHVCFYKTDDLIQMFHQIGFVVEDQFFNYVTYPRELNLKYTTLFEKTPQEILEKYNITIREEQVFITVKVFNVMFRKNGDGYESQKQQYKCSIF
jgi:ubiquinone/menaquinone biosynthesis C-methylase UbiE